MEPWAGQGKARSRAQLGMGRAPAQSRAGHIRTRVMGWGRASAAPRHPIGHSRGAHCTCPLSRLEQSSSFAGAGGSEHLAPAPPVPLPDTSAHRQDPAPRYFLPLFRCIILQVPTDGKEVLMKFFIALNDEIHTAFRSLED